MKIIAYNHTHWDREWYKTFQEFRLRFVEVMDLIIREIQNKNIDCFYLDGQTVILEDYFELHPENKPLIQELIGKNKIITGPWYVLADEFLVSGESLFRNMLIGTKQAKELGCNKFIGYLPDSFGHNSEIPRILSAFEIKNAVLWRGAGSQKSEFIWKSEDNSSVIATYLIEGYFQNIFHYDIPIQEKAEKLKEFLDKIKKYSVSDYILLPIGGDHLGTVIDLKNQFQEINQLLNRHCEQSEAIHSSTGLWIASSQAPRNDETYTFETGGIFEYIEKVKNLTGLNEFTGELRDNSRNPILPGTLSTRLYLKQANALSTWKLSKLAEPFYTYLYEAGFVKLRKSELEYAWKLLLKNHPHDNICGCSIDEVHDEMLPRFAQVNQISDELILRGQNTVSQLVNKDSIWIYNTSDYQFSGVIKLKTNKKLSKNLEKQFITSTHEFPKEILLDTQRPPFSEDIEEFKEYLIYVENIAPHSISIINKNFKYSKQPDSVEISENFIKNSRVKIDINPDGTLKLTDFELNKTFEGLHYFYDRADIGDTYNYSPLENDIPIVSKIIKTKIIKNDKLRSILRIYYELDIPAYFDEVKKCRSKKSYKTVIITDISITSGSKRAEFKTSWENKSKDHILQIKADCEQRLENGLCPYETPFKASNQENHKITETFAENTFGVIKREFDPDYSLKELMPIEKGKELKTNTAPMQRFVYANGLGVITEGLCEYGTSQNELYITILRAVGKLSKLSLNTRNFPAGPPLDTPGAQCLGNQTVKYAICAVENPIELFKESDEFFGSIIADVGNLNSSINVIPNLIRNLSHNEQMLNQVQHDNILSFFKTNNKNIYTYAVKLPENKKNSGMVLRLMNLSEEPQKISLETDLDFSFYAEVNGMEEFISKQANFQQELDFKPFELKSIFFYKNLTDK